MRARFTLPLLLAFALAIVVAWPRPTQEVIADAAPASGEPAAQSLQQLPEFILLPGALDSEDCGFDSPDEFQPVIDTYGDPQRYLSTENEIPPPAIPLRIITYEPENVKIVFALDVRQGEESSDRKWSIMCYFDSANNTAMSSTEARVRLGGRLRTGVIP